MQETSTALSGAPPNVMLMPEAEVKGDAPITRLRCERRLGVSVQNWCRGRLSLKDAADRRVTFNWDSKSQTIWSQQLQTRQLRQDARRSLARRRNSEFWE
jgi:hypothetical protein